MVPPRYPNTGSRPMKTKPKSRYMTKHLTNRLTDNSTARSLHDLIHSSLCMDMHRSTLVYIYLQITRIPGPGALGRRGIPMAGPGGPERVLETRAFGMGPKNAV